MSFCLSFLWLLLGETSCRTYSRIERSLQLGMSKNEVIHKVGRPVKKYPLLAEDSLTTAWLYKERIYEKRMFSPSVEHRFYQLSFNSLHRLSQIKLLRTSRSYVSPPAFGTGLSIGF